MGFYCAEASSRFIIRDYMLETFDRGVIPCLHLLMKLLEKLDKEIYEAIKYASPEPTFALSWILTWFSHDLNSFS